MDWSAEKPINGRDCKQDFNKWPWLRTRIVKGKRQLRVLVFMAHGLLSHSPLGSRVWERFRESSICSRDSYPKAYITEYVLIYEDEEEEEELRTRPEIGTLRSEPRVLLTSPESGFTSDVSLGPDRWRTSAKGQVTSL